MIDDTDAGRRRILLAIVGLAAAAAMGTSGLATLLERLSVPQPTLNAVRSLVSHHASARRLGDAYLAAHPGEADARVLFHHLVGVHPPREHELATWLLNRMTTDFAAARTVTLDGWILSRTEGRLYALVAMG